MAFKRLIFANQNGETNGSQFSNRGIERRAWNQYRIVHCRYSPGGRVLDTHLLKFDLLDSVLPNRDLFGQQLSPHVERHHGSSLPEVWSHPWFIGYGGPRRRDIHQQLFGKLFVSPTDVLLKQLFLWRHQQCSCDAECPTGTSGRWSLDV